MLRKRDIQGVLVALIIFGGVYIIYKKFAGVHHGSALIVTPSGPTGDQLQILGNYVGVIDSSVTKKYGSTP